MFGKELFIRFTVRVIRKPLYICAYVRLCFGVLIVLVPGHCPSFYLLKGEDWSTAQKCKK